MNNKVHLIYFSCYKHFKYLLLSLKSLEKLNSIFIGRVYLFIDKEDYLKPTQIKSLNKLRLNLKIRKWPKITGWGEQTVINELDAFMKVHKQIYSGDYIAKVDSDILFLSDKIFKEVLQSNSLMIGHPAGPIVYIQGGCYFLKNSLIPKMLNFDQDIFNETLEIFNKKTKGEKIKICPEDFIMFNIVKNITNKIKFINFYTGSLIGYLTGHKKSPISYRECIEDYKEKNSAIHFGRFKHKMLEVYDKIF